MGASCTFRPIGIIRSEWKETEGSPIQGVFAPDSRGTVELFPGYADGLRDIEGFSHLWLLYVFHRSAPGQLLVRPFMDERVHGVFATRAPRRPNPIGLSLVRLLHVERNVLEIAEVDVLDGTPLLDIKPYVRRFDQRDNASEGWLAAARDDASRRHADARFAPEPDQPPP